MSSTAAPPSRPRRLADLFEEAAKAHPGGRISVGEVLDSLSHRSFGPLLLLPALISVLPGVGALPGVTWTTAALCLFISVQFLIQRRRLWLPERLRALDMSQSAFAKGVRAARPWLLRADGFTHPRLRLLLQPPAPVFIALLCVALSLAMFVYSLVPGGVVIPAVALILIAIGLTTHDGAFLVTGAVTGSAALSAMGWLIARIVSHLG